MTRSSLIQAGREASVSTMHFVSESVIFMYGPMYGKDESIGEDSNPQGRTSKILLQL